MDIRRHVRRDTMDAQRATIPPLMQLTPQRDCTRAVKTARCVLIRHQLASELRLMAGELLRSQACRSLEEILDMQDS